MRNGHGRMTRTRRSDVEFPKAAAERKLLCVGEPDGASFAVVRADERVPDDAVAVHEDRREERRLRVVREPLDLSLLVQLELECQRVAARERSHGGRAVGMFDRPHVPGIPEVVHHLLRVIPHRRSAF